MTVRNDFACFHRDASVVADAPGRAWVLLWVTTALACSKPPGQTGAPPTPPPSQPAQEVAGCGTGRPMTVRFYDVGQALAAMVDLPDGRHILVDTGDRITRGSDGDSAERSPLARIRADLRGAPLDLVWITHQHSDHIGGAADVIEALAVTTYVDNGRDADKADVHRAHLAARARQVARHVVDPAHAETPMADAPGVKLTAIVPPAWPPSCLHDPNECSIGLRVDFCASSVLFTGDAEHEEEKMLDLRGHVTLLQVGHHGSETSTSPGFLARARPHYAVISAGKPGAGLNREYCHPRAIVVERLTRLLGGATTRSLAAFDGDRCDRATASDWVAVPTSAELWATERDGDVILVTTGDGTFRRQER